MDRVDALAQAWREATQDVPEGEPVRVDTSSGVVCLVAVEQGGDTTARWVDVTVDDPSSGDPLFRVINPPTLVPDPDGDVTIGDERYRHDPVRALATVIGTAGGARPGRGW